MIFNRKVAALVPIKEHSKRVTGKNFRDFCGRPLYEHILRTLDRTYAVDEILIDTDSDRVIRRAPELSRKIRVVERPEELCGDLVSMNKIIEVIVSPTGETKVETKGFTGAECQEASRFVEVALGQRKSEQLTAEYHHGSIQQQMEQQQG